MRNPGYFFGFLPKAMPIPPSGPSKQHNSIDVSDKCYSRGDACFVLVLDISILLAFNWCKTQVQTVGFGYKMQVQTVGFGYRLTIRPNIFHSETRLAGLQTQERWKSYWSHPMMTIKDKCIHINMTRHINKIGMVQFVTEELSCIAYVQYMSSIGTLRICSVLVRPRRFIPG
ncbi:hypothetical protein J5N97_021295 [Dioscorea zingiberensis]|uniref:Uncharacterized protein n=1 Tax=Dioscorea zingiberensis TaxID=325984 RepID=A0A9D5HE39_9LILI|nr:hypothetical protein J5N97_021295 [Dioscorea zingiberensis]